MNSPQLPSSVNRHRARLQALRSVAAFEFAKGIVVLVAALSLHWLDPADVADSFLALLHISPDHHLARLFLEMADRLSDVKFWHLALGASIYSGLRITEAVGLWRARPWAEWIALVSGALYLPLELRILMRHASLLHASIFIVNLAIVAFMFYLRMYVPRQEKRAALSPPIQ